MVNGIIRKTTRAASSTAWWAASSPGVYTEDNIIDALGASASPGAEMIYGTSAREYLMRNINSRSEGFDLTHAHIPRRFADGLDTGHRHTRRTVDEMLRLYRRKRGWS